jgi:hypothetical protein
MYRRVTVHNVPQSDTYGRTSQALLTISLPQPILHFKVCQYVCILILWKFDLPVRMVGFNAFSCHVWACSQCKSLFTIYWIFPVGSPDTKFWVFWPRVQQRESNQMALVFLQLGLKDICCIVFFVCHVLNLSTVVKSCSLLCVYVTSCRAFGVFRQDSSLVVAHLQPIAVCDYALVPVIILWHDVWCEI